MQQMVGRPLQWKRMCKGSEVRCSIESYKTGGRLGGRGLWEAGGRLGPGFAGSCRLLEKALGFIFHSKYNGEPLNEQTSMSI